MLGFFKKLHRGEQAALGLQALSWLAAAAAGSILPALQVSAGVLGVVIVLGLVITVAASSWQISQAHFDREKEIDDLRGQVAEERRANMEGVIQILLAQLVKQATRCNMKTRANVFLPDETGHRIHIAYQYNMVGDPDLGVRWAPYQGCSGHAWASGDQTVADLRVTDLRKMWKLDAAQIALTTRVASVLSTPIYHPNDPDKIVGVLSIDSEAGLLDSHLDDQEIADTALQSAKMLAHLLLTVGAI